jgi:deoxyribodipyrimidine photo-lyase
MKPVLLWMRRNLRLADNAPLIAAAESGRPVIPVYVCSEHDAGGASRWWLHHSLASLDHDLRELGSKLVIRSGSAREAIVELARETGATSLFFTRRYEPACRDEEEALEQALGDEIELCAFDDSLLNHPNAVMTQGGKPFKVFTPFWKASARLGEPPPPAGIPGPINFARDLPASLALDDLRLLPTSPDWAGGLRRTWQPGESGALGRLDALDSVLRDYGEYRDRPATDATSRLSPHLHFGEISVRQLWYAVRAVEARLPVTRSAEMLLRQLYWRDFSAYILYHFPTLPEQPLRSEFGQFPWADDPAGLQAWQKGMTGYPIVDAGMRQLWTTGWMHNRVRMIVASFLVKDLLIPWQQGADWFLDTLVDADLANNSASWQWVAGCGTDAAPYFRIFNPVLQGQKFDPQGAYVREWIPEIAGLPDHWIHEPWKAPAEALASAGIVSGEHYPQPIVVHAAARDAALEAYQAIRGNRSSKVAPPDS